MGNSFTNKNTDQAILNDLSRFHGFYNNVYRDPFIGGNAFIFVTKNRMFNTLLQISHNFPLSTKGPNTANVTHAGNTNVINIFSSLFNLFLYERYKFPNKYITTKIIPV